MGESNEDVACFLMEEERLLKGAIGELLGEGDAKWISMMHT